MYAVTLGPRPRCGLLSCVRVRRPHNRRGRFADAIVRSIDASHGLSVP